MTISRHLLPIARLVRQEVRRELRTWWPEGIARKIPRRRRKALVQAALIRRWQLSDDGAYTPYHPIAAFVGLNGAGIVIATLFISAEGWLRPDGNQTRLPAPSDPGMADLVNGLVVPFLLYAILAWPPRQAAAYQRVCAAAYFSRGDQLRLDHLLVPGFFALAGERHLRPGTAALRLRHARSWARQAVAVPLLVSALMAMYSTAGVLWLAWRHGYVQADRPVDAGKAQFEAWRDVAWNAADSVPFLELTKTLHWERPTMYADDRMASVILLLGKILIFSPTIAAIVALFRRTTFDPEAELSTDPVEVIVIEELTHSGRARAMDWVVALEVASSRISDPPEDSDGGEAQAGPTWTPNRLVSYLVVEVRPAA